MPSRLTVYQRNVPPIDRTMMRCAVCSQWVDADRTAQPEESPATYTATGSVYFAKKPGGEIDFAVIDKTVEGHAPPYSCCPFCFSPRYVDGAGGPLKR